MKISSFLKDKRTFIGLIVTFIFLQAMDVVTTLYALELGGYEHNALTRTLVSSWYYIPVKMIPVLCAFLALILFNRFPKLHKPLVVGLAIVVIIMALVVTWNIIQISLFKMGKIY